MDKKPESFTVLRALPLLWLSIAFLAGVILASQLAALIWLWLLCSALAAAAAFSLRTRLSWPPLFALAAGCVLFLGATRYQVAQPQFGSHDLATFNDSGNWAEIQGQLQEPPVSKDGYIELVVRADGITLPNGVSQEVEGLLQARTEYGDDWHYGDRLLLSGELTTPVEYEDFSYRDYLARQGVYSLMPFAAAERLETGLGNPFWTALYGLRERGVETLYRLYPAREAALLAGILLGDESGLSDKAKTAFNDTGTRHIIAISGFNISIIAGLFLAMFGRWLGTRRGIWLAGIGVALYTLLVGADATVVRSAIMGILGLIALRTGRQPYALNTLGFTAAAMALVNPLVLWDIGFQLSFAATLGLILYSEPLRVYADQWMNAHLHSEWTKRLSRPINDYVLLTIAAQITTLPMLLYYFERLSIFSLPANILILPVQPALMVLGGLSMLVGMILFPLGQLIGFLGWTLAAYTIRIVEFFAGRPWSSQTLTTFPLYLVFLYFGVLAAMSIPAMRQRITSIRIQPIVGLIALAALNLWTWNAALAAPDDKLHLTLLDLEGEALLIRSPAGRYVLINTGASPNQLMDELSRKIPLGQRLDWVILAGERPDQLSGIKGVLERLSPNAISWASSDPNDDLTSIIEQATALGIATTELKYGDQFELGAEARLEVLSIGQRGAVLLLKWGNFEAVLPLGLDFDQMQKLSLGSILGPIDLLLLADSGYPPLNPPEWLSNLGSSALWIDSENERVESAILETLGNTPSFRTDQNGWLQVITDGQQMWFQVDRP